MKDKVNEFVDLFHSFHDMGQTTQIVLLAYFHTVEEANESVSRRELERLFAFSGTPKPKILPSCCLIWSLKEISFYKFRRGV